MKTKILISLLILSIGVLNFSCSKSDDTTSKYDEGKSVGKEFQSAYTSYKNGSTTTALLELGKCYAQYKANSSDGEWKSGFLAGATSMDTGNPIYSELGDLLDSSDASNIENLLPAIENLLK